MRQFERPRRRRWPVAGGAAIGIALVSLVTSLAATGAQAGGSTFHPIAGKPFSEPPVVRSHNGVLTVTLTAVQQKVNVSGSAVTALVYKNSVTGKAAFTGPTLMVKPGDTMNITLVNELTKLDQPTNLHFHGLHVSPAGRSDNIFLVVEPGATQHYVVKIPPDHPSGLYWYHSHMHHLAEGQVFSGMSGLIVIDGITKLLPPNLRNITQRVFALRDLQVVGDTVKSTNIRIGDPTTRVVNNLLQPVLTIRPGETQLWRFANIGADVFYKIAMPGVTFHVIAEDGRPVWSVWSATSLVLPPAKRFEVLVQGPKAGTYPLKTLRFNGGVGFATFPEKTLATVKSQGSAVTPAKLPTKLPVPDEDLSNAKIAKHRLEVFTTQTSLGRPLFAINGKQFEPGRVDVTAKLGTVEEWTLRNGSHMVHPFHIHTDYFQVMSIGGVPYHARGFQDVVVMPPGKDVVIRIDFEDFVGTTVFHCHILQHEDAGMMATIKIVR